MTSTTPSKGYDQAWVLQSNTDPTKTYIVSKRSDGNFACSCAAWKFHKAPKVDCKHCLAVKDDLEIPRTLPEYDPKPGRYKCDVCGFTHDVFKTYLAHKAGHRPTPVVTKDRAKEIAVSLQARPDIRNPNPEPDPMERFTIRRKFKLME